MSPTDNTGMTDNTDNTEARLARGLKDRAGDVSGAPVGLDEVKRTARGIRRRRRATAALAAAAVIAVVVPVGLSATSGPDAAPPVGPAATTTPSPTAPTASPASGTVPLTVAGAAQGKAPAVGYLSGRSFHAPGGTLVTLPAEYESVAPYRGGFLGVRLKDGGYVTEQVDVSGRIVSSEPGGDRIVTSADGVEVSWVAGGKLWLDGTNGHSDSAQSIDLPTGLQSTPAPIGFLSAGTVLARVDGPGDGQDFWVTQFKDFTAVQGKPLAITSVNEDRGLLGLETSFDGNQGTSCWAVATNQPGDKEPKSCDWTVQAFSPHGNDLVGFPSGTDGPGSSTVALINSTTFQPAVTFQRKGDAQTFVQDVVWEDDGHVLASMFEDGTWYLVRLGLDGTIERLDQADGGNPDVSPFHFAAHG